MGGVKGCEETLGEAGELSVLRRVLAQLGAAEAATLGPGDDCAVLGLTGRLVVTTDSMVEGPDFRLDWHSGFDLGWKLAATNLSDVAAMGARPIGLTVALAAPRDTPVALLEEVARGLDAACRELAPGCGVVGGDLGRAPVLTAAVTALGDLEGRGAVTRSGATGGDVIAYAGDLGLAGIGLRLLFEHGSGAGSGVETGSGGRAALADLRSAHPAAVPAQLAPEPPIFAGVAASLAGATAMLDVSDGLALDAARLSRASGVTMNFDSARLADAFGSQRGAAVSIPHMLFGGEDHGLLATFPAGVSIPTPFAPIGTVEPQRRGAELLLDGAPVDPAGWDPYA